MNRFSDKYVDSKSIKRLSKWLPLLLGVCIVVLFLFGVNYINTSSLDKQQESLENAISRDIAQCYAVEGVYPPNLEYITEHYGLTYNEDLFFVDYQPIGGNIFPDVTIIRLDKQSSK